MNAPDPSQLRRLCLVRLSALGDVCLMVPLVRTLQRALPQARITWVISRPMHEFLSGLDGVEFIVIDKPRSPAGLAGLYRRLRQEPYDALLAAQASFRANFLYPAIRAPFKLGFDRARARDFHGLFVNARVAPAREHLLDGFLAFATALGVKERVIDWRLPLTAADHEFAGEQLGSNHAQPWLAVNPGASKPERNWFADRYAAVIEHAAKHWGCRVVLTGGRSDRERALADEVVARLPASVAAVNLVGRSTARQLAAVLSRTRALVAPDTGPVHIATAVGTPVVGLYAVAPPELSGPYLTPHLVVNRFPQAVRQVLGQDPAAVPWGTRVHTQEAMRRITVADVIEKLGLVFAPRPRSEEPQPARAGV